jgi:hypothetical protein
MRIFDMKRLLCAIAIFAGLSGSAFAQSAPSSPAMSQGLIPTVAQWIGWFQQKQDVLGTTLPTIVTNLGAGTPAFGTNTTQLATMAAVQAAVSAPTNAALQAISISGLSAGVTITRRGFTAAGDSQPITYTLSTSACPLNSGAGDNGSQVKPTTGTGCWIWSPPSGGVAATVFGAAGTANTLGSSAPDDTAALNAAIAATGLAGIPLQFDTAHLYKITSALAMSNPARLQGPYRPGGAWTLVQCPWGIVNYNTGINGINFSATTGTIDGVCIDMTGVAGTQPTAGIAINLAPPSATTFQSGVTVTNNGIVNVWDGIAVNGFGFSPNCCGDGTTADGNFIGYNTIHFPADAGISHGKNTAGASTVGMTYTDNTINCLSNTGGTPVRGVGFELFDGSFNYDGTTNGPEGCTIGFLVAPGAINNGSGTFIAQNAQFVAHGVFGDQSSTHDLVIQPTATSGVGGVVDFIQSDSSWVGATGNVGSVLINCQTAGTSCEEFTFTNMVAHGGSGNTGVIFDVEAGAGGPFDLSIVGSNICQFGTPGSGAIALKINITASGDGRYVIGNNRFGTGCPGSALATAIQLSISGGSPNGAVNITGNDMSAVATPISYTPSPTDHVIINNNTGIDDQVGTVASAASITLPASSTNLGITGTTAITSMAGGWSNRKVTLILQTGTVAFNTGGTVNQGICNAKSLTGPDSITANFNTGFGCWLLH